MTVKLLTEDHLEFLSSKGVCRGSSESSLVKMSHCWKSHAAAQWLAGRQFSAQLKMSYCDPLMSGACPSASMVPFHHLLSLNSLL